MKISLEELSDVTRYIDNSRHITLEEKRAQYEGYLRPLRRFTRIDGDTRMLEVGTGTGWFPLLCKMDGLQCKGLEISPKLIEYARECGKRYGIEPDIELGNLEETDIGANCYDVVIASNVFEHVEYWQQGIATIYRALKPGGVMFFESTNKFAFTSGEYTGVPLYGWLPNGARYRLRMAVHGPDIMKLGIDFHQFTHPMLRAEFRKAGFSRILDRVEMADEEWTSSKLRKLAVRLSRRSGAIKAVSLLFADATRFLCFK